MTTTNNELELGTIRPSTMVPKIELSSECEAAKKDLSQQRRTASKLLWEKVIQAAMVASKFVNILNSRRQTYAHVDEGGRVLWMVKLMFAAPQFALIPLTLLINVFIIKFYLDVVQVSAAFIAFFQIFARSFDVLTDPLMAHVSDNLTRTRFGRRIPYMMLCPLYSIAFLILVSPPDDPNDAAYWFGGSYLFFYFCDTLINVPFQALGPELTDDSDERTSLYMCVKIAEGIGVMIGTLLPGALEDYLEYGQIYQLIAVIFGSFYIISMYTLIKNIKERKASYLDDQELKQPFVTSIYRSMRNVAFRPLVVGWILDFAALSFIATMVPFYVTYYIEVDTLDDPFCDEPTEENPDCKFSSGKHLGYVMACFFVSGFVSIPIWKYLARHDRTTDKWYDRIKIGKVNAWLTYNVVNVVTNIMYVFVPEGGLYYLYVCMIFNGIPIGGQFLINSILADVIDYDEFLNFKRNEGQFTVFASFVPKIIAIPCQSFPLVGMFILGYSSPGVDDSGYLIFEPQNTSVKWFIRGMFVFAPLMLVSISFLVKRTYPIKKFQQICDLSRGITLHMQGKPAIDPITGQEVYIEQYEEEETYLIYLLDQFNHSNLLWLLSPDQIYKRHKEQGLGYRKSTLRHLRDIDLDTAGSNETNQQNETKEPNNPPQSNKSHSMIGSENIQNEEQPITNTKGLCSCFDTKIPLKEVFRTKQGVEFGKDDDGNIVYVAVANFEAHGVKEGVKRIKSRVMIWIMIYIICDIICVIGLANTISLLNNPDYAFIPAVFCLCFGLSIVGAGFNVLRFRAANEIRTWIEKNHISDDVLAKCIYPKSKGQRGGAFIEDNEELESLQSILPEPKIHPQKLRSLTNIELFMQSSMDEPEPNLYD